MYGRNNYHARVRFHDGSRSWLLRVPRIHNVSSLVNYLVVSEYATLKFLEKTKVPAPRAFGFGISGRDDSGMEDHGVGVAFLLIEELPGKPWLYGGTPANDEKTRYEKAKIWDQLAGILAELARHPSPRAGSLCLNDSARIQVGPVASDKFMVLTPEGPFDNAVGYYTAWAEQYLALIADRQLYEDYPVEAYMVYRFLKDNVWQLVEHLKGDEDLDRGGFFLKHVDDLGDHILLDDDCNIVGLIDWQMARVVPRAEAFGPSLVAVDTRAFFSGRVGLGVDDHGLVAALEKKGHADLARWMGDENERARRFFWGLGLNEPWPQALPMANAILQAFGVQQDWAEWSETALKAYCRTDRRLQALLRACPPRRVQPLRRCKQSRYKPYRV